MYASTLPRSNWLRRASIRLAWYRHMPASSCCFYSAVIFNCYPGPGLQGSNLIDWFIAVPNVTAYLSTASVPIPALLFLCGFNVPIKWLTLLTAVKIIVSILTDNNDIFKHFSNNYDLVTNMTKILMLQRIICDIWCTVLLRLVQRGVPGWDAQLSSWLCIIIIIIYLLIKWNIKSNDRTVL